MHLHGPGGIDPPELVVHEEQGSLQIEVRHRPPAWFPGFHYAPLVLDLYVPPREWRELSVQTVSGDVRLERVRAGEFRYRTVSGNLAANGLATGNSRLVSTSGDFEIAGFRGGLDVRTVSGDLDLKYDQFANEVQLNTTSGNLALDLPANPHFTLEAETISGELSCGFPLTVTGGRNRRRLGGAVGGGGPLIQARTVSGNLRLN